MKFDLLGLFIEQTDARLVRMEKKLDGLLAFKWQLIGGSLVVSATVGLAVQLFLR